jgi:ATP-dependent RNA helicase DeaD
MLREASGREGSIIQEDREPDRPEGAKRGPRDREPRERDSREREPRGDRGNRDDGGQRGNNRFERGPIPQEAGMTRMFLSLGKTHGVMAKEIVGMLYREAGLPDGCLGRITLFPKHSLVDIPDGLVEQVMQKTKNTRMRGRTFRMDVDRGPQQ